MIKAVFFDFYNTLARFHPPREEIQAKAARGFGMALEPAGVLKGYVEADHLLTHQNARQHIARLSDEERMAFFARYEQLILKGAGYDVSEELAGKVWARVRQIPYHLALYNDALPALEAIKRRGLTTGLISNVHQDLAHLCKELGLAPLLDLVVTSRSAGAEKPDPRIFRVALEKAGVLPEEAIHVGDQYDGDVAGARAVGIRPILLDRDGFLRAYQDVDRVRDLGEVIAVVDRCRRGTA